jgi:hypothetical protein
MFLHVIEETLRLNHLLRLPAFIVGSSLTLWLTSVSYAPASAQVFETGPVGGITYYLGDLNPGKHFQFIQPAYGLMIRYNFDTRWAVKLSGTYGKVKGDATSSVFLPERGLTFSSNITDISAVAEFNFFRYFTGSKKEAITPYIYAGISVFFFNPKANGITLKQLGTEGQNEGYQGRKPYALTGFAIPFGLGVKVSVSKRIGMTVFWEMHKTFTDYLDDVSSTYYLDGTRINPADLTSYMSDPTMNHKPGMERGDSKNMDWYSFTGISIAYRFVLGSSKRCRDLEH